jgi:OmpA-OmpF porin, OOP family
MQINLLDIVKKQMSKGLIEKAAHFLEEDKSVTQKAMDMILPSILGGVMHQTSDSNNATNLLSKITEPAFRGGHDGSIFETVGNLLDGGSATQGFLDSGESIVSGLFGNKMSSIVDWIAAFTGMKTGSASGLMNMAAPLVMGAIGKQVIDNKLDANGLTSLLQSQSGFISKALPAGLSSVLGLGNLKAETPSVFQPQKTLSTAMQATESGEKMFLHKILPWIIMIGAGMAGMMFLRTCKNDVPQPPSVTPVPETPPVATPMNLADTVTIIKLPEGDITVRKGSFLDELNKEVTDNTLDPTKALTFDNVNFATGSAILTENSKTQLNDLVKIMKAYPKVSIKIEGHTDNKGNAQSNKKLSQNRAESVMKYLQTNGIEASRMTTEGLGAEKPKADNATEQGRAANRRIEAFVVKK